MSANLYRCSIALLLAVAVSAGLSEALNRSVAQEQKEEKKDKEPPPFDKKFEDLPLKDSDHGFQLRAACVLVGLGDPLGVAGVRVELSEHVPALAGWEFAFDMMFPLNQSNLDLIQDGRLMPSVFRKELKELTAPDRGWYLSLLDAIRRSDQATMEMFEKSAEENKSVLYTHLASKTPERYRGKIITLKGKLTSVVRYDPPRWLDVPEITEIFAGTITNPQPKSPPFAVIFTRLPPELQGKDFQDLAKLDLPVTFYGYFLSRVRFPVDKDRGAAKKEDVVSPYLVGKTLIVRAEKKAPTPPADPADSSPFEYGLFIGTVSSIIGVIVLGAILTFWFRRSDRNVHSQLQDVRDKHRPFALEPEPEETEIVPPRVEETKTPGDQPPPLKSEDSSKAS